MTTAAGSTHRRALCLPVLVVALVLLTACTAARAPASPAAGERSLAGADASRSRAAELRAGLTHLLVERTYVTAAALSTVGSAGGSLAGPAVAAELASLDASAVALAELLGASSDASREPVLAAVRGVDRMVVAYAVAAAGGEPERLRVTREEVVQAQGVLAGVLRRVLPGLRAEDVADRLGPDLDAQLAVGGDDPYALLRVAAARAPDTAELLAGGIVRGRGMGLTGTRAATLRAELTALLAEHTLLVGALGREVAGEGAGRGAAVESVVGALEANGRELAGVVGSDYPAGRDLLQRSWDGHVGALVRFARARTGSRAEAERRSVLAYPPAFSALLAQVVPGLPVGTMEGETAPALADVVTALEAAIALSPAAPDELRAATASAPAAAALLAAAIAEDLQLT